MSKEIDNTKIMVLDRCFSDQRHKYSIDDLLDKVNEFRYDVSGPDSTIKERTLRKYISRIRNMLPSNVYLESRPYDGKNATTDTPTLISQFTIMRCLLMK